MPLSSMKKFSSSTHTGDGALGGSGGLDAHGRAGSLGGHGRSQAGSSNTDGGHCDGCGWFEGRGGWKDAMGWLEFDGWEETGKLCVVWGKELGK
jgi:hypothetical protein